VLNEFAKTYVAKVRVVLRDDLLERESGQSDLQRKIIYLARKQKLNADAIGLGLMYAYSVGPKYRRMKLQRYEMYFLTLLHEIGHFKLKERIPRKYEQLKKELVGKGLSERLIELSFIENRIKRKPGERAASWRLRLADFMSWLTMGETITHHLKVENWAIDEFERKRKIIAKMLWDARLVSKS